MINKTQPSPSPNASHIPDRNPKTIPNRIPNPTPNPKYQAALKVIKTKDIIGLSNSSLWITSTTTTTYTYSLLEKRFFGLIESYGNINYHLSFAQPVDKVVTL